MLNLHDFHFRLEVIKFPVSNFQNFQGVEVLVIQAAYSFGSVVILVFLSLRTFV